MASNSKSNEGKWDAPPGDEWGKNMRLSVRTWATAHTQTPRSVRWSIIKSKF